MDGNSDPIYDAIPYDVAYDHTFEESFAAIEPDQLRRDNRMKGIEYVIARIPTSLQRIGQTNVYRIVHDGEPALRIWYTFDGTIVTVRFVEIWESDEATEE
jgi:hypothetical protein